ncbi:hypothetical protein GCM10023185_44270 [Hymenobacter saemangeumensis]|uniref:Outer membrane protein assembly factor BamE n=1 Tax=Hymenobacter saemangeumensis TaxID=1084522 RepID=A0ABP8IS81_9BACT
MKETDKKAAVLVASVVLFLMFCLGVLLAGESYNPFDPYADTEFASDYTPEKFRAVKVGMTLGQVREIVGEPLFSFRDSTSGLLLSIEYHYTNDGYLRRRTDKSFVLVSDLAWYRSGVTFNADSIVCQVDSGWSYD